MSIEIDNETDWDIDQDRVNALAEYAMDRMHLHPNTDLFIRFVDLKTMEELHIKFMDEPGPTDVLSFPMDELVPGDNLAVAPEGILGDVVVCPDFAKEQAEKAGHAPIDEMLLLITHGILHLLGFDHAEPDEEREMFAL
ncbi:MAG: rRNA maturation RNase YbeY, partial [Actinomycetales bacterium]|nr:rRNA maturation RNase YbeY [Actinomycetales bacterium]